MSFFICHYVILSYKNHQFLSVTLLFCLQKSICLSLSLCHYVFKKNICLPLSLCHYVFKKTSVSLCHYVIMSSKKHMFLSVTLLFCLPKKHLSTFVIMSFCLQKNICLPLRPSVILSENAPVGDESGPSCCCCYFFSFCLISIFHKLCYVLPHYLSSIYSF